MKPERRNAGYTLIEVLVAFVILALALTALLNIFAGGVRSVAASTDYVRAALIADTQLAAAGIGESLRPGETSGIDDEGFAWTRTVEAYTPTPDYASGARDVSAWYVTVTVQWPHGSGLRQVDVSTVKLDTSSRRGS